MKVSRRKLSLASLAATASQPQFRRRALLAWRSAVLIFLALLLYQVREVRDSIETDPATASQLSSVGRDVQRLREEVDTVSSHLDSLTLRVLLR